MSNTKEDSVLLYFQRHGHLSSIEAIDILGDTRLPATVKRLKERGYSFKTIRNNVVDKLGNKKNIAIYYYLGLDNKKKPEKYQKINHCLKKKPYYVYQVRTDKKIVAEFEELDKANTLAESIDGGSVWKAGFMEMVNNNK